MEVPPVVPCCTTLLGLVCGAARAQSNAVFEPNRGQAAPEVEFVARTVDGSALLAGASTVFVHGEIAQRMDFLGASPHLCVEPGRALAGRSHYFRGNDPARWVTDVPHHDGVRFVGLYPGVDLAWHGSSGRLEYDIELAPGAEVGAVAFRLSGFDAVWVADDGGLHVLSGARETVHVRPVCWQVERNGSRSTLECEFALDGDTVRFDVPARDPGLPVVIDPVLVFSTYLGGTLADGSGGLAVDATGNVVIAGWTASTNFPVAGGFQSTLAGSNDVYVSKLSADGTTLLWSTLLGGSQLDGSGPHALALDSAGRPCVTGSTLSADFPTTPGCLQPTLGGGIAGVSDAFVSVLAADGSALAYSSFVGGPNSDGARAICVDAQDRLVITGYARAGFPTTAGAYSSTIVGDADLFATVVAPNGMGASDLVYSTYVGGSLFERGEDVAIDSLGRVHVAATVTTQKNAVKPPTTPTAFRPTLTIANNDTSTKWAGYYVVIVPAGAGSSDLSYATFVNSRQTYPLTAYALAVDVNDRAFITGVADGATIATTASAFDSSHNGSYDLYLTVVDPALSGNASLAYGSYLGSSAAEITGDIALDASGRACVVGFTTSNVVPPGNAKKIPFPTTADAIRRVSAGSWDCTLTVLDVALAPAQQLVYSTLIGGVAEDHASNVALGASGRCFVSGIVAPGTGGFPTTPGAYDTTYNGDSDTILMRLDL